MADIVSNYVHDVSWTIYIQTSWLDGLTDDSCKWNDRPNLLTKNAHES